jgi:hypothetical protein
MLAIHDTIIRALERQWADTMWRCCKFSVIPQSGFYIRTNGYLRKSSIHLILFRLSGYILAQLRVSGIDLSIYDVLCAESASCRYVPISGL